MTSAAPSQALAGKRIPIVVVGLNFGHHIAIELGAMGADRDLELVGVSDLNAPLATEMGEQLRVPVYADLDAVLADPTVVAVALYTPPAGRAQLVQRCIDSGKHVITTKPFEASAAAGRVVLENAARRSIVVHLNAPAPRISPDVQAMKSWRDTLDLGQPIYVRGVNWANYREEPDGTWYDDPLRCPVAPLFRIGIYLMYDILDVVGECDVTSVTSSRIFTGRPTPDNAHMQLVFPNGALGSIAASFCVDDGRPYQSEIDIAFERGRITRRTLRDVDGVELLDLVAETRGGKGELVTEHLRVAGGSGSYQWSAFAEAIRGREEDLDEYATRVVRGLELIERMAALSQN